MTDHGGAASPRTEAGKRLRDAWWGIGGSFADVTDLVLAIEAEAAQEAPAPECGFEVNLTEAAYGNLYEPCRKPKGHAGSHSPVAQEAPAPEGLVERVSTILDNARVAVVEALRAEARPPEGPDAAYETRLYVTADEIEAALKRLQGPVSRDEATVMAAAQAAADALRGGRIVAALSAGGATKPQPTLGNRPDVATPPVAKATRGAKGAR